MPWAGTTPRAWKSRARSTRCASFPPRSGSSWWGGPATSVALDGAVGLQRSLDVAGPPPQLDPERGGLLPQHGARAPLLLPRGPLPPPNDHRHPDTGEAAPTT